MPPKSILFVPKLRAFLGIALLTLPLASQTKDDLVGTWRLVAAWTTRPNGERVPDYGDHPVGFLTYTREGRVVAVVGDGDRKSLSGNRLSAPASERAEAFSSFLAYAGRYTVNGGSVVHHVEVSSVQNWVNTDQVRVVKLEGDRLTLSASNMLGGERRRIDLMWQRLR